MNSHKLLGLLRLLFGAIGIAAIVNQLLKSIELERSIPNFFSFFTIESNIVAAVFLVAYGSYCLFAKKPVKQFSLVRGAATLYMTMTGIIFYVLLSGQEVALQTTIPWVNSVLHYILPAAMIADWLLFPPKEYVPFKRALLWLVFPILYLIYSLVRGSIINWYPYPFINPILSGWPTVIVICFVIAVGTFVLAWVLGTRTNSSKPKQSM